MATQEAAEAAIRELNGREVGGREIEVKWAKRKADYDDDERSSYRQGTF